MGLCLKRARRSEAVERAHGRSEAVERAHGRSEAVERAPAARKRSNGRGPLGSGRTGAGRSEDISPLAVLSRDDVGNSSLLSLRCLLCFGPREAPEDIE